MDFRYTRNLHKCTDVKIMLKYGTGHFGPIRRRFDIFRPKSESLSNTGNIFEIIELIKKKLEKLRKNIKITKTSFPGQH